MEERIAGLKGKELYQGFIDTYEKKGLEGERKTVITDLLELGQDHLFENWDPYGTNEEAKETFIDLLVTVNHSYPGGLRAYIRNAAALLKKAQKGENAFKGFKPSSPETVDLTHFHENYLEAEALGMKNLNKLAVVMVAGGLGERLGYNGLKIDIPVEVITGTTYIELYASYVKALGDRAGTKIPFVIMTSGDTDEPTRRLLEANRYFGLEEDQVILMKQELVPAISDNEGRLALKQRYELSMKPHGHGDVHMLMYSTGTARYLKDIGKEYLIFIQDTNGQVFNAAVAALGASIENHFDFNSLAVNRIPGEAVGALTTLSKGEERYTINVEYNMLDALLRESVNPEGDVADENGFSVFPGNINVLMIRLSPYLSLLEKTRGIVAEFINPKYKDDSRTVFKKPTRLETLMQDLPKLFENHEKTGVTVFNRPWCFSADKNAVEDAAKKAAAGGPPESGASAESDFYDSGRKKMIFAGCEVSSPVLEKIYGVPFSNGPRVIIDPSFAVTLAEVKQKVRAGVFDVETTLILKGRDIFIESINLENRAAVLIDACDGAHVTVKGLTVSGDGYVKHNLTADEFKTAPQYLRIRGYRFDDKGAVKFIFKKPGHYVIDTEGRVISG